ncbi:MAG: hypothetical protein K0S39_38 [Paenibacillus sp.]|jgi:hypothetical protein|nr:hypothetical protein [Paenibacillus sp.]
MNLFWRARVNYIFFDLEVAASSEALNRLSNELLLSLQRFRIE